MRILKTLLLAFVLCTPSLAHVKVVTSFSILADLVKQLGGDHVILETIVGPDEDAHVFNPSPQHGIALAHADLVIINGLGFEGWMDRLISSSGFKGTVVVATIDIKPMLANGAQDPHAWHSIPLVMKYVDTISQALQKADPSHAKEYKQRTTDYKRRLHRLDEWVKDELSKIDIQKRKIITAHDAFQYFAAEYGIKFLAPQGVSTQAEATPEAIMKLIDLIRKEDIKMIFVENIANEKQMQMIQESTGARIGGTLYSDALSPVDGAAPDYISLMKHNVMLMTSAMK